MKTEDIKNKTASHYDNFLDLYEDWSGEASGGYHFGIANKLSDIFHNDVMVKNLNDMIIKYFDKSKFDKIVVLDAGCGVGDVAKHIKNTFDDINITGITLSKEQVKIAHKKNKEINIAYGDFEDTNFEDNTFDIIFFIDSICHGVGSNKNAALKESYRILKPEGRLVVCDVFLQKEESKTSRYFTSIDKKVKSVWSVDEWSQEKSFLKQAQQIDFKFEISKELTLKIVPSVMHIIFSKIPKSFLKWLKHKNHKSELKYFLILGFFVPLLGIHPNFKYKIIVFTK